MKQTKKISSTPALTRTERVHQALRRAIIEQKLVPGARLPEDAIGESFGTSRTIAREALGRLAMEGLVDLKPNRGAFVAHPSLEEGRGTFAVRRGLERFMIESLSGKLTPAQCAKLQDLVAREAAAAYAGGPEAIRMAGEFHLTLAEMTENPLLIRYITETVSRCSLMLAMYGRPHSADCGAREHADIVAALVEGDNAKAVDLMDRHLADVAGRALLADSGPKDIRTVLAAYVDEE